MAVGPFLYHAGPKADTGPFPVMWVWGQNPPRCSSGHFTACISLHATTGFLSSHGALFIFFIFKSTIVLRSVFLLAKVTAGPTLFRVSCLPSLLQPLSRSLAGPTPLIFNEGRLVFPPPYKRETPALPLSPSAFFETPPRPCYC